MARKIIVVTAAYGNDHVKSLGGQAAVLPFIANAGADGVEIRRELCSAEELNALPSLAATIERHGLLACYSAPQALFTDNGELNPDLPTLLAEAQTLNALWLKLSLGHFLHNQQLDELRDILSDSGMALVVENDQTDCGQLAPMQRFKAACRVHQLPITLTFDMGNWLWVGDSPEEAARHLDQGKAQLIGAWAGELLAEELRLAQQNLSEITGEFTSDDLLGRIFSSFCIGK